MSFWIIAAAVVIGLVVYKLAFGTSCTNASTRVDDSYMVDSKKKKKKVLVLTAHPDDECMFFAPTILGLRKKGIEVNLLCMTSGNYYGKGKERKKELISAASILGIGPSHVFTLNHRAIEDGPEKMWNPSILATVIDNYVQNLNINILVTFDEDGISGHTNHMGLFYGVSCYLKTHDNVPSDLKAYKLVSTSMLRKYSSILDVPFSYVTSSIRFVSGWCQIWTAQRAMFAHWSQFVWYRILYIIFSRYMIINTLERFEEELALKSS